MFKNFLWQTEDEPQNMLTYLFLMVNVAYGIGFTFFGHTAPIQASIISMAFFPGWAWGIACLALVLITLVGIYTKNRRIGNLIGFPGVCVWGYGMALAILSGNLLAAFAVYLPQILFWVFWHVGVQRFYEKESIKNGRLAQR